MESVKERLEYLRGELREERISYGELAELQGLAEHIENDDVELLEAAGIPEDFAGRICTTCGKRLPIKDNVQSGYFCCDEYYCSQECLDESFNDADGLTWEEHYHDDGDCYWTEWESEV